MAVVVVVVRVDLLAEEGVGLLAIGRGLLLMRRMHRLMTRGLTVARARQYMYYHDI